MSSKDLRDLRGLPDPSPGTVRRCQQQPQHQQELNSDNNSNSSNGSTTEAKPATLTSAALQEHNAKFAAKQSLRRSTSHIVEARTFRRAAVKCLEQQDVPSAIHNYTKAIKLLRSGPHSSVRFDKCVCV